MGYLARDQCHATQEAAAQAACAVYPVAGPSGLTLCEGVQPGGAALILQPPAGAASSVQPVSFGACDEMQPFNDQAVLFGAFLAACAVVWAVKNLVVVHIFGNH